MSIQEALDSFACPGESKISIPPAPLAAYPDQAIISFFLNIPRTLHRRAEHRNAFNTDISGRPQLLNSKGGSADVSISNLLLFR